MVHVEGKARTRRKSSWQRTKSAADRPMKTTLAILVFPPSIHVPDNKEKSIPLTTLSLSYKTHNYRSALHGGKNVTKDHMPPNNTAI